MRGGQRQSGQESNFPLADFAPGPAAFDNHPEPGLVCPAFVRRSLGGFFPFLDNTAPALILVPMMLLSLGLTCFAASATVYLRDTPHLVAVVTQVLFS